MKSQRAGRDWSDLAWQNWKRHYKKTIDKYLTNIHVKIVNKIWTNRIEKSIKRIIRYGQVGFISDIQGWFNIQKPAKVIHSINWLKKKHHMITLIDIKTAWQNPIPIHNKNSQKTKNRGELPQLDKAYIIVNNERLNVFFQDRKHPYSYSTYYWKF